MLNEKAGVRLPISSVDEWTRKGKTTLGIASSASVATGLQLRVNISVNIFCRSGFTCKFQLREEKILSLHFQPTNFLSLKHTGASFSPVSCWYDHHAPWHIRCCFAWER